MSEIENRKIQDVLREAADAVGASDNICNAVNVLREALGSNLTSTWGGDLAACLRKIADRVDRQGVVEVRVPGAAGADMAQDRREVAARIREVRPDTGGFVKALSDAVGLPWVVDGGNQQRLRALRERLAEMVESAPLEDPCAQLERQHALPAGMVREAVSRLAMGEPYAGPAGAAQLLADFYGLTQIEVVARLSLAIMTLPYGADNEPLRLGDEVEARVNPGEWERGTIEGVGRDGDVLVAVSECASYWLTPDRVRHHRPRTIDDVLADMAGLTECEDWGERAEGLVREAYELGRGDRDE